MSAISLRFHAAGVNWPSAHDAITPYAGLDGAIELKSGKLGAGGGEWCLS
jgi:hypothetical protein